MGRKSGNEGEFKAQSYFRLLRYARPYWFRLTVGIVSGILVGGSLLVSLLMIPRLVGAVERAPGETVRLSKPKPGTSSRFWRSRS